VPCQKSRTFTLFYQRYLKKYKADRHTKHSMHFSRFIMNTECQHVCVCAAHTQPVQSFGMTIKNLSWKARIWKWNKWKTQ
jgi:hypothetical protein